MELTLKLAIGAGLFSLAYGIFPGVLFAPIIAGIIVGDVLTHKHYDEQRATFTQLVTNEVNAGYPNYNVIVYHDQGSENTLYYSQCEEFDHTWAGGHHFGYTNCAFYDGDFRLRGDGGYINWAFMGNFIRDPPDSPYVKFIGRLPIKEFMEKERPGEFDDGPEAQASAKRSVPLPPWNATLQQADREFVAVPKWSNSTVIPSTAARTLTTGLAASGMKKRDAASDGAYLVNCQSSTTGAANSAVAYYGDFAPGSNNGQKPDGFVWVAQNDGDNFGPSEGAARFVGGEAIRWRLIGTASGSEVGADGIAGFADDGVENFFVYKGDGALLFEAAEYSCYNKYYAY